MIWDYIFILIYSWKENPSYVSIVYSHCQRLYTLCLHSSPGWGVREAKIQAVFHRQDCVPWLQGWVSPWFPQRKGWLFLIHVPEGDALYVFYIKAVSVLTVHWLCDCILNQMRRYLSFRRNFWIWRSVCFGAMKITHILACRLIHPKADYLQYFAKYRRQKNLLHV